jgi:hypothetical protein
VRKAEQGPPWKDPVRRVPQQPEKTIMKIYPYQTSEGLIDLVPIEYVNELNERLQERTRDYLRTMGELRAENFRLKNASQTAVLYHKQSLASEDRATENLRKLEKAEAELSISNDERDHYRRENIAMREAIKDAHQAMREFLDYAIDCGEDNEGLNSAEAALSKLQPFTTP